MDKTLASVLALLSCILIYVQPSFGQTCDSYTFSSNQVFSSCSDLPVLSSYLYWNYHESNNTVDIAFRRTGTSSSTWVAWALNPSEASMVGSQALVAYQNSSGSPYAYTSPITSLGTSMAPGNLSFGVSNLLAEYSATNSEMIIFATLQLTEALVSTNQVWQEGPMSGDTPGPHPTGGDNDQSVGSINFRTGATAAGGNSRTRKQNVHGVLNAVSWGTLMPMGVMMARYLKVFKSANPAWFYLHVACQSSAYIVGVAGWATGIKLGSDSPGITQDAHRNIGIVIFCLGTLQVFALLLRPKPDHKYRFYWNIYHHSIGYATIILSIVNIYEGFDILDPEKKWKRIYTGILIFLGISAALLEAFTWYVVIRRKKTDSSDKYLNGGANVNGYHTTRTHQTA